MIVHALIDEALSPDFPLGDSLGVFFRRTEEVPTARGGAWHPQTVASLLSA